jgi:hypothetical protein
MNCKFRFTYLFLVTKNFLFFTFRSFMSELILTYLISYIKQIFYNNAQIAYLT